MTTITCTHCGMPIELTEALTRDIEKTVLANEHAKHIAEMERVKQAAEAEAKQAIEAAQAKAEASASAKLDATLTAMKAEAEAEKDENKQLREQILQLTTELRESRKAAENAEITMQTKLAAEESKIRDEAMKEATERQRLDLAMRDKTIQDLQKSLDEAQRKAAQGSQQMQGEVLELDFEKALADNFRDDSIEPVAKGTKGGDILQAVKSPRGVSCGIILWEIKRTKNWTDGWIPKLKEDMRNAKANLPVIITEVMPKQITEDMGHFNGVWVTKPKLALVLATLLRKSLLDAGYQRALAENRGGQAEALYSFITSHEFIQQIESMVETYQEIMTQVQKERVAYERMWALRDKQAQKLMLGTANIIGSMQGHIGMASMPKIKGLELLEGSDNEAELVADDADSPADASQTNIML
ncbi:DUF2130 domain-containing protein [Candidatus Saccharibacteria bacterium]|nr:DUF2130 domain-containing protein [Candidatus Saccharibacteria bacterium]